MGHISSLAVELKSQKSAPLSRGQRLHTLHRETSPSRFVRYADTIDGDKGAPGDSEAKNRLNRPTNLGTDVICPGTQAIRETYSYSDKDYGYDAETSGHHSPLEARHFRSSGTSPVLRAVQREADSHASQVHIKCRGRDPKFGRRTGLTNQLPEKSIQDLSSRRTIASNPSRAALGEHSQIEDGSSAYDQTFPI
jgi:hypothetical protein